MDFHKLEVFCRVVDNLSITRTAEAMHLSQPAVSLAIRRLEQEIGTALIQRQGRQVLPTPAGRAFYRHARAILAARDQACQWLKDFKEGQSGQIVIGASTTGVLYYLPPLLELFRARHPRIEVALHTAITDHIREAVAGDVMDIGFVWGPTADPRLQSQLLTWGEFTVIVHPSHPLAHLGIVAPGALAREPFILARSGSSTRWFVESRLREVGIVPRAVMEFDTTEAMKLAVEACLGVAVVSRKAVERETANGLLRMVRVEGLDLRRPILAIWARHQALSPAAQRLLEMASAYFARL